MKRQLWTLLLVAAVLGLAQPVWADDFYVIAGGGGVGTKITSLPYTITKPGFYYSERQPLLRFGECHYRRFR